MFINISKKAGIVTQILAFNLIITCSGNTHKDRQIVFDVAGNMMSNKHYDVNKHKHRFNLI